MHRADWIAAVIGYNLLMAGVVWRCLVRVRAAGGWRSWLAGCLWTPAAALGLAAVAALAVRPSLFAMFYFAAYGLFGHLVGLLALSALLLWSRRRWAAIMSALAAAALVAVAIDGFLIEPQALEVSYVALPSAKVDRPVRIVLIADLQADRLGRLEREVFRRAMAERPDVILLAGDYLQVDWRRYDQLRDELNRYLRSISFSAPWGAYAVQGNVDDPQSWPEIFAGLPVRCVRSTQTFRAGPIRITCLAERRSFSTVLEVRNDEPERFHVVLGHSPNFALGRIEADLLLAGHTHGGQVQLPGIGPVMNPSRLPRRQASGRSTLPSGATLIVSRGVGMERVASPRLRLFCRPELVVIDVLPH